MGSFKTRINHQRRGMKVKAYLLLLILCVQSTLNLKGINQGNLVGNGEFTYWVGSDPLMWTVCGPNVDRDPDHYVSPPYSAMLSLSGCIVQLVHNITGGQTYTLKFWHLAPDYPVTLHVTIRWYNSQGAAISAWTDSYPPVKTWRQETVQLESPVDAAKLDVKFHVTGSQQNEKACIDNVELEPAQPPTTTPTPTQSPSPTPTAPSGEITGISAPDEMTLGQEYTMIVHVANTGLQTASFKIMLQAPDFQVNPAYKTMDISPGGEATYQFTVTPLGEGTLTIRVNLYIQTGLIDTEILTVNVSPPAPTQTPSMTPPPTTPPATTVPPWENGLEVSACQYQVTPFNVEEGETLTVIFTIQNNGQQPHTYQVTVSGQSSMITVQPGRVQTLIFQLAAVEGQTYTWTVTVDGQTLGSGVLSGFTVKKTRAGTLTIAMALTAAIVAAAVIVALKRRL